MKAIMLSIQPQHCELIASGKKTIEVRKTAPKLETPFKCYIYETKGVYEKSFVWKVGDGLTAIPNGADIIHIGNNERLVMYKVRGCGKVIGEFVCDRIETFNYRLYAYDISIEDLVGTQLGVEDLNDYGNGKTLYGLHITDLKIYDKPKELGEFYHNAKYHCGDYVNSEYCKICSDDCKYHKGEFFRALDRPSQSWCYV